MNIQAHTLNTISKEVDITMNDKLEFNEMRVTVIVDGKEIDVMSINGKLYRGMCQLHDRNEVKDETIRIMLGDMRMILEKTLR